MMPTVLNENGVCRRSLVAVAKLLEAVNPIRVRYEVEDVCIGDEQGWMYTTIVRHDDMWGDVRVLPIKHWERIMLAISIADLADCVTEIDRDGF